MKDTGDVRGSQGMRSLGLDIFLGLTVFFLVFFLNLPLRQAELLTADGSVYLDIGRNLFSGKGAVSTYNLFQYWSSVSHPFPPYTQPLFPLVGGFFAHLGGLKAAISFNIFLVSVNSVLFYAILRAAAGALTAFLVTLFMGFSQNFVSPAICPWTEQFHFFFVLAAVFFYLKNRKNVFVVGFIFGLSCLARVAGIYNFFSFLIAWIVLSDASKDTGREFCYLLLGFLSVLLTYEFLCFFRYGAFYPQYLAAAKTYYKALHFSGAFYAPTTPVLNMGGVRLGLGRMALNVLFLLSDFLQTFRSIKILPFVAVGCIFFEYRKRKNPASVMLFFQGIGTLFCYILSLSYLSEVEAFRFSMIPYVTLGGAGFLFLKNIVSDIPSSKWRKSAGVFFFILMLSLLVKEARAYGSFRHYFKDVYPRQAMPYRQERDEVYGWIKAHSHAQDRIASVLLQDALYLERPFVSFPSDKMLTPRNLLVYLSIYQPRYVLLYRAMTELTDFMKAIGFSEKISTKNYIVFGQNGKP